MTSPDAAMVFVVDDDASVRASIQGLLKSARLRCASFATAEEFLRNKLPPKQIMLPTSFTAPPLNVQSVKAPLARV